MWESTKVMKGEYVKNIKTGDAKVFYFDEGITTENLFLQSKG